MAVAENRAYVGVHPGMLAGWKQVTSDAEATRRHPDREHMNDVEITEEPISPERVVVKAKTNSSGCVVTYVGVIRDYSQGRPVLLVEYQDPEGNAVKTLHEIADEARKKWQLENLAIVHRKGKLMVGDINLVVAVAAAHRAEGFAACQYIIDQFKGRMPTSKKESYRDG
ncbi:MAG: molybdenum cofactor biosynthesis protein MoaE [Chloroflexi bacterium]|nr:molybdenum cofactor biosynthesis protein MoaE [Chloroflexota bacterium]